MAPPDPDSPEDHSKKHSERPRKVAVDPLEPTTSGALLVQSLLHLHAPHNALVLDRCARCIQISSALWPRHYSIESLQPQELLVLTPTPQVGARRHHRRHNDPAACAALLAPCPGSAFRGRDRRPYWRALLGGGRPVSQGTQAMTAL